MTDTLRAAAALVALGTITLTAQAPSPLVTPAATTIVSVGALQQDGAELVPLKVTVLLSRFIGEKKISSLPYILGVTANGKQTTLRMGLQVPVFTTVFAGAGVKPPTSYNYRDVGTNIDCLAIRMAGGLYQLAMTVNDSSVHVDSTQKPGAGTSELYVRDVPSFRSFNSSFTILLKDGQSTQYTSATDPVTGEVMKIDVTLNLMK